jgi:curved DNA-binding protein
VVDVTQDPRFERKGSDLHTTASVDVFAAILGGEVEVETLAGKVTLKIPPGTQPDQVFRLSGRGMPDLKKPQTQGDLFVRVKVRIPKQLSPQQKAALEGAARLKSGQ